MTIAQEEIFGPVLYIIRHDTEDTRSRSPTIQCMGWRAACGGPPTMPKGIRSRADRAQDIRNQLVCSPFDCKSRSVILRERAGCERYPACLLP